VNGHVRNSGARERQEGIQRSSAFHARWVEGMTFHARFGVVC